MKELRDIVRAWQARRDDRSALATLVRARGSSYRRPGARMIIFPDGAVVGSVSAGCLEDEVASAARAVITSGRPRLLHFDTRRRFGCHGSIEVFIERTDGNLLGQLSRHLESRCGCAIETRFEGHESRLGSGLIMEETAAAAGAFRQRIEPTLRLIIFGDGPDTAALSAQCHLLGWDVDRVESVTALQPEVDDRTAVVISTHNYGRDCAALRYFLPLGLRYVGVIGPRRRRDELMKDVLDSGAALNSEIFGPAGLHLAAESPEEIALAIAAEVQSVFAGGSGERLRERRTPIHQPVISLWEGAGEECALSAH